MARSDPFDPIAILQALDERRVRYVVVGALGRVILGSDELTDGIDIVPSPREENLHRLGLALDDLHASRADGTRLVLDADLTREPALELRSEAGELKLVLDPAGTQGYDDLRRSASSSRSAEECGLRSLRSETTRVCSPPSTANATRKPFAPSVA